MVLIRMRVHPFPFRTRKLSSFLPKILVWRRTGKIGNANTKKEQLDCSFFFEPKRICFLGLRRSKELAAQKKLKNLKKVLDK